MSSPHRSGHAFAFQNLFRRDLLLRLGPDCLGAPRTLLFWGEGCFPRQPAAVSPPSCGASGWHVWSLCKEAAQGQPGSAFLSAWHPLGPLYSVRVSSGAPSKPLYVPDAPSGP